jgi:hypothetical protein
LKFAMLPEPEAARPIEVLLFVQVTEAPVLTLNAPTLIRSPEHTLIFDFCVMILSGRMVIVKLIAEPEHELCVPITLIVPTRAAPVVLVGAVNMISPLPLAEIPIAVLVFVHASVAPGTLLVKGMLIAVPGQKL